MTDSPILGWHFLREGGALRTPTRDPEGTEHAHARAGLILRVEGPIARCERGLHASRRVIDALWYAPGPVVSRVRLAGTVVEDTDQMVAVERTVLWLADATHALHQFACWCAEQALLREREQDREPDPRCWAAIEAKRRWLRKEIDDDDLDAAAAAARDAAWAAARAAARDAARAAAWAAARAAAWAAARDAAWAAARDAARTAAGAIAGDAAWAAARDAQNAELERALNALAPAIVTADC